MNDFSQLPLQAQIQGLRAGDFSSLELTRFYLERIEQIEPELNAFITITPRLAVKQAEQADTRLRQWRSEPHSELPDLLGIPIAIKDVLCYSGVRTTAGSLILDDFIPPYHATAVNRLVDQGMVLLGKTNTDEFAMGSSTENSAFGPTSNPWDFNRVPGGSSGGSAAAVSARLAPIALGTDTGGSVRQPAGYCGVTGLKPTYGSVSRYGLIAFGSSLDVVGVLGRSAEDVEMVFNSIAGLDILDATSRIAPVEGDSGEEQENLKGLRIGIPDEYFTEGLQPSVRSRVEDGIAQLRNLGAEPVRIQLPHTEYAVPVYYLIAPAEASANLARFDGIRYGPRISAETMWEVFLNTRGELFGAEVKRRIMLGTYALSSGYYEAYYGQAQKVRTLIRKDFEYAFKQVDLIASPLAPTTAFIKGAHLDDPLSMYLEDILTIPANLAGIPALAFPVGFDSHGMPVGMQLMASHFHERLLLRTARIYQQETEWHNMNPPLR
jgi:aspartyl-tRNA(Asn)/glutamyl-tRNA(Gln) amidotransferase subunit A